MALYTGSKIKKGFLGWSLSILWILPLIAQEAVPFEHYTFENGLSNSRVRSFTQDRYGFIWIGTAAGLNRFDGYEFTVFEADTDKKGSLYHSGIPALLEDRHGNLWVGSKAGLQIMNRQKQGFFPHTQSSDRPFHSIGHVVKLLESQNGDLWVGAVNGLFRIRQVERVNNHSELEQSIQNGGFTVEALPIKGGNTGSQSDNRIWSLKEEQGKYLWVGTNAGLACYHLNKQAFVPLPVEKVKENVTLFSAPIQALASGKDGKLWVGTEQGLYAINAASGHWNKFETRPGIPGYLQNDFITELAEDSRGYLWVGTDGGGLSRWDHSSAQFTDYINEPADPFSLIDNNVEALYQDDNEGLWVGTHKGVSYVNLNRKPFQVIQSGTAPHSISRGTVEAVHISTDGTFWLGIDDGGISKYDPARRKSYNYYRQPGQSNGLTDNDVVALLEDKDKNIWIGSWGGGVSLLKPDGRFHHFIGVEDVPEPVKDPFIWAFLESHNGDIWIGTVNRGLVRYRPEQGGFINFNSLIPGTWVKDIAQEKNGTLWFVTSGGLFRYEENSGKTEQIDLSFLDEKSEISILYTGSGGALWLGTDKGLVRYEAGKKNRLWNESSGLADNWVKSIEEDAHGNLWLGTGKGISRFVPEDEVFVNYGTADVLLNGEFTRASAQAEDGRMLFGNINGLVTFHPDSITAYTRVPEVVLTDFQLFNRSVPIAGTAADSTEEKSPLTAHITHTRSIQLKYWQNYIAFEFAALDYLNPSGNVYKYRLKGLQKDWVSTSSDYRIASFTDLSPGHYTFQAMGGNADGIWNEQPAEVRIYIAPPWWRSWWAYLIYALLLAGATIFSIRMMKRRWALRAQLDFNQREAQRLKELDQFKSRLYTNLTHEFRTPLTVILGMAEQIRTAPKQYLEQGTQLIENNGRSLLRLINQLLDLSKLESNALQLNLIQADVISYLRYITASFQTYANSKNLSLRFFAQPDKLLMDYDPDQLQQVMYNLISNAVKFTPSGGEIVVRIRQEQNLLKIRVKDNGIGISRAAQAHIFDRFYQVATDREQEHTQNVAGTGIGLAHTRELVKLMKGSIEVDSEPNKGTIFTICLPVEQNAPARKVAPSEIWQPSADVEDTSIEDAAPEKPLLLIIEDNPDVVLYLKSCLSNTYRLDIAYNGKIGIEKAVEHIPDLIISDVMMPEKDGYEVCDCLKQDERTSHIPIILLTAKADMDSRIAGLKRGADAYLSKPFNKQELLVRLEKLVERQQRMAAYFEARAKRTEEENLNSPAEQEAIQIEGAFIQKVRSIIAEHYEDENFALPDLCAHLGMSRSQLYRKMKALTNTTPSAYIRLYRLNAAKKLLQEGGFSVSEVAWKVGYKDPAHFSRSFLEEFDQSPSDLIK